MRRNALYRPIRNGDLRRVIKLLDQGAVNVNDRNPLPLHVAVVTKQNAILDYLLKKGADLEARDLEGNTALHLAACLSDPAIATSLISAGAELDARDIYGNTPLHVAASFDRSQVIEALLASGADSRATDTWGNTPLQEALRLEQPDAIATLSREKTVDTSARTTRKSFARSEAARRKRSERPHRG